MAKRKTIDVKYLVIYANNKLKDPELSVDHKKGVSCFIEHVLLSTDNYSGFGYYDSYDPNNWDEVKEYNRFFYFKGQ